MDFRSKVVSSSLTINVTVIAQATIQLEQHPSNRHGAEEARGAHNPEDLGSKPSVGIFLSVICIIRGIRVTHFPVSHSFPVFPLPLDGVYRKGYTPCISRQMAVCEMLILLLFFRLNGYSLFLYLCNF